MVPIYVYLQSNSKVIRVPLATLVYWYASHYFKSTEPEDLDRAQSKLLTFPGGCSSKSLGILKITLDAGSIRPSSKNSVFKTSSPVELRAERWELQNPLAISCHLELQVTE